MTRAGARTLGFATAMLWMASAALPGLAAACPVCGSAKNEENQIAYLATTGFMTFLPLILVGGLILWIRKRVRDMERDAPVVQAGAGRLESIEVPREPAN